MYALSRIRLRNSFDRKVILIFSAIVLDAVATVWLMAIGFEEANPAMAWIAKQWDPSFMAIFKITWSLILMAAIMLRREFHKYVDFLVIGYFVLYTGGWWAQLIWEVLRTWTPLTSG